MVNFGDTHRMVKDASLFSSLSESIKQNIYVVDDYALEFDGFGDIQCG